MSVSMIWAVKKMDCYQQVKDLYDVVFNVHWRVDAVDGPYSAALDGSISITPSNDPEFTLYDQLSEAQVINWVKCALGDREVAAIEENLKIDVASQPRPIALTHALPWATV